MIAWRGGAGGREIHQEQSTRFLLSQSTGEKFQGVSYGDGREELGLSGDRMQVAC